MTYAIYAYAIHQHVPMGAPMETKRKVIFVDDYRGHDGEITGDLEFVISSIRNDKTTISVTPLFAKQSEAA